MRRAYSPVFLVLIAVATRVADAQPRILDACDALDAWQVMPSDGVEGRLSLAPGVKGQALRLDFNFKSGAGYCVVRRALDLPLPANYRFSFALRGEALPNTLEFKLVDPANQNVWWINTRDFQWPREWQTLRYKARQFRFAWGPSGGKPLDRLGAVEIVVTSSQGGSGAIFIDELTFEELPEVLPPSAPPRVHFSSVADSAAALAVDLPDDGALTWRSSPTDTAPSIRIDFGAPREFGGVAIEWADGLQPGAYVVSLSEDGARWEIAQAQTTGRTGRDYIPLRDAEAAQIRVDLRAASGGVGVGRLRVLPVEFAASPNAMFSLIARERPRGYYPRYFLGEQQPWTVVGVPADAKEGLFDVDGALEVDRLGYRIEPFVYDGTRLLTWNDGETTPSLDAGYLPIPSVRRTLGSLVLETRVLAEGPGGWSQLLTEYTLRNVSDSPRRGALVLAVRPFQVLPPWQELNLTGGATHIETLTWDGRRLLINQDKVLVPWTLPDVVGLSTFGQGEIVEHLARGVLPTVTAVNDPQRLCSGAMQFGFELEPGQVKRVIVSAPLHAEPADVMPPGDDAEPAETRFDNALDQMRAFWTGLLSRVTLQLPPAAAHLADTFRAQQAYILINADGPAIQPGSRTYERSWARDGSLTSTALLYTGHADYVRAFLDWFAPYQFESGKVPCVVDRRGPDPVAEHDSQGQLIYILWKYYKFTGDRALLERHLERVVRAVDYIETLRAPRLTPEFRDGPPEKRRLYGLVTESISHEGYSAQPMHSYWDNFFVVRGLKDAVQIARTLERPDLEARFARLLEDYRTCFYDSVRLAVQIKDIDYFPGCAELGDFDATSTAIGVFPGGELTVAPQPLLRNTFERYWKFFLDRRDGRIEWRDYTPYEVRLIGSFVRLGQPERARALLDFFLADQQPTGWRQWGEVAYRDKKFPGFVGDMPHTWVGGDFLSAARSLFVYEDEADRSLVLLAAVAPEWLAGPGLALRDWPTEFGTLSCTAHDESGRLVIELAGDAAPPGGVRIGYLSGKVVAKATFSGQDVSPDEDGTLRLPRAAGRLEVEYR